MLSDDLLELLRAWWRVGREKGVMLPGGWLLPGQNPVNPLTPRQLSRIFHAALEAAGIDKPVSLHALRHCFATNLLEHLNQGPRPPDFPGAPMPRESLEVADIFRAQGAAWRRARASHLSLGQLKVMSPSKTAVRRLSVIARAERRLTS